jgi:hypothetical protein
MEKETGKKTGTVELFLELEKEGLRYLVVGGFALNLYGVDRATFDLDIAICPDRKDIARLLKVLARAGYKSLVDVNSGKFIADLDKVDAEEILELESVRVKNRRDVDILIVPSAQFDYLWQYRLDLEYEGVTIPLPNPMDLIHMKEQSSRPVDIEDARKLRYIIGSRKRK